MSTENDLCSAEGCHNKRISLSKYCGAHVVNATYLNQVIEHLNSNSKHQDCTISDVELEPENTQEFTNHSFIYCTFTDFDVTRFVFKNTRFDNCEFSDLDLYECTFENCEFVDCHFDQAGLYQTHFISNTFEQCEWDNSDIFPGSTLPGNKFNLCRFTQFNMYESEDLTRNHFEQCIFVLSSINYANFDHSTFIYTEFSKTPLSYSSFRHATLTDIDQDFELVGPPSACDFYGATVDAAIREAGEKDFCNFEYEDFLTFATQCIEQILREKQSRDLGELSYFLHHLHNSNVSVAAYRERTLSLFKYLYQEAVQLNDVNKVSNLIDDYVRMPEPIREQGFFLPSPVQNGTNQARMLITFAGEGHLTFPILVSINGVLSILEHQLFEKEGGKLETRSITHGSIIQEIIANYDKILVFAGALYAATNAILSLVKKGAEIQKIRAETRKINTETDITITEEEKGQQEILQRNQTMQERIGDYQKLLAREGISIKDDDQKFDQALNRFLQADNDVNSRVAKLDRKYRVEEIKVIVDD